MNAKKAISLVTLATGLFIVSGQGNATDLFHKRTTANTLLSITGGAATNVLQATITPGTWKVTAKTTLISHGTWDWFRCVIKYGTTVIDGSTTMIGGASSLPAGATVTNLGVFTNTANGNVVLACLHDTTSTVTPYIDPNAQLIVERISSGSQL